MKFPKFELRHKATSDYQWGFTFINSNYLQLFLVNKKENKIEFRF
jgi:hypothetical protein